MNGPALIFDLDGTLVDSVYEHVAAWHEAFTAHQVMIPAFEYHKRVGLTGPALVRAVSDAFQLGLPQRVCDEIAAAHTKAYRERRATATAIPGIAELWNALAQRGIRWAIATSATADDAHALLSKIHAPEDVVLVTQAAGGASKPAPDTFARAAKKLHVDLSEAMIVGDAVWDMLASRRAGALGIGVLTGGYGREELVAAGAYRVYRDVVDMSRRFTELGL